MYVNKMSSVPLASCTVLPEPPITCGWTTCWPWSWCPRNRPWPATLYQTDGFGLRLPSFTTTIQSSKLILRLLGSWEMRLCRAAKQYCMATWDKFTFGWNSYKIYLSLWPYSIGLPLVWYACCPASHWFDMLAARPSIGLKCWLSLYGRKYCFWMR